jgi:hypothetical protein
MTLKRLRWWLEVLRAYSVNEEPRESFRCAWEGHQWVPSMEFGYLHYECAKCHEVGETIMDTDEMVDAGLMEVSSMPIPDDIQAEITRILSDKPTR